MNRNRSERKWRSTGVALICLGLVLLPWMIAGCKSAGSGPRPAQVYTAEEWPDLEISNLAYLGLGASIGDQASRDLAADIVEQELRGSQTRFVVLDRDRARSRAENVGKVELYEKVGRVWKDVRKVDLFLAKDLCETLGVDGLILADLSDWRQEKVDWHTEGVSWSRVGLGLYIYSAKSGLLAWGSDQVRQKDSILHRPSSESTGFTDSQETQRTDLRNEKKVPEPPSIEDVAREVMAELIAGFPPKSP